jgi:hypothetical protein
MRSTLAKKTCRDPPPLHARLLLLNMWCKACTASVPQQLQRMQEHLPLAGPDDDTAPALQLARRCSSAASNPATAAAAAAAGSWLPPRREAGAAWALWLGCSGCLAAAGPWCAWWWQTGWRCRWVAKQATRQAGRDCSCSTGLQHTYAGRWPGCCCGMQHSGVRARVVAQQHSCGPYVFIGSCAVSAGQQMSHALVNQTNTSGGVGAACAPPERHPMPRCC